MYASQYAKYQIQFPSEKKRKLFPATVTALLCLVELEGSFYVVSYNFAPIFRKFDGLIMSTSPDIRQSTVVEHTSGFWPGTICPFFLIF